MNPDWIDAKEFCQIAGITRAGLHSRMARGQIEPVYPPAEERGPTNSKPLYFLREAAMNQPRQRRAIRRFDETPEWSIPDLAYLAGIIDGEGCVSILRTEALRHYNARLQIVNTCGDLMIWINDTFGPGFLTVKPHHVPHWKTSYIWIANSITAWLILRACMPYLRVKKRQAEILMEFIELVHSKPNSKAVSDSDKVKREELRSELININGRQKHQR